MCLYVSSPHLKLLEANEYILQDNPFASVLGQHGLSCWTGSFAEDPGFHSTGRSRSAAGVVQWLVSIAIDLPIYPEVNI